MLPYTLVLFDWDGTLADTETLHAEALSRVCRAFGLHDFLPERCATLFRGTNRRFVEQTIADALGRAVDREALHDMMVAACAEIYRDGVRLMPGALSCVTSCIIPRCIVSNGNRHTLTHALTRTPLVDYFPMQSVFTPCVAGGQDAAKPSPAMFLYAASLYGVSPEHCLVVEDSAVGVQAARRAGMHVCAVAHAPESHDALHEAGAHRVVTTLADVQCLINAAV
jgi:HAD superfamily hydrolase (TIGR01509 family)